MPRPSTAEAYRLPPRDSNRRCQRQLGIEPPGTFRKFVCGRKLWNYDNLEPAERKLVL